MLSDSIFISKFQFRLIKGEKSMPEDTMEGFSPIEEEKNKTHDPLSAYLE